MWQQGAQACLLPPGGCEQEAGLELEGWDSRHKQDADIQQQFCRELANTHFSDGYKGYEGQRPVCGLPLCC